MQVIMTCGIYKLTSPSGKIYIGQSVDIEHRFIEHKSDAKKCFNGRMGKTITKLRSSFKKYIWENFTKEIIKICSPDQLNEEEIFFITLYDSFNNGLNCTSGGQNEFKRSAETKQKLREHQLGKYGGVQAMAFYIDGVKFLSILDAASKLKIPQKTIHNRLNSKNLKYSNYVYEDLSRIPERTKVHTKKFIKVSVNNVIYDSASDASIILSISISTILRRARSSKKKFSNYKLV